MGVLKMEVTQMPSKNDDKRRIRLVMDEQRASRHLVNTIRSLDIPVIKDKKAAEKYLFGDDDEI
ncbi:hypothetical protein FD08_GL004617 [Lentilactobacillus parakefiri DSM 10551]|nr:hypothetical protein FD08_GL004617 [Lentilactobacillus parakefiri DSM 10551]